MASRGWTIGVCCVCALAFTGSILIAAGSQGLLTRVGWSVLAVGQACTIAGLAIGHVTRTRSR